MVEKRGEEGRRGRQKSIRRNVRLNERNVNHKKLRAFKSPTRWCTFALITLHLSFLPWPPSSWSGSNPGKESSSLLRENSRRTETTSPFPSLPFPPSSSTSHLHSVKTSISFIPSLSLFHFCSSLLSLTRRNFLPRIDHLQGRALLGIISYVAVESALTS